MCHIKMYLVIHLHVETRRQNVMCAGATENKRHENGEDAHTV